MEESKGVEEYKQTLNILKRALIMEREERKENAKIIEDLRSKLKLVGDSMEKKVISIQNEQILKNAKEKKMIDDELQKAEERVKTLVKTKSSPTKANGTSRSIQALEQQNDKLLEEFNIMQKENTDDETKIATLKQ